MEFGKGFGSYYSGWEDLCKEYPDIDRETYPALFRLPDHCYEVKLMKPLGIASAVRTMEEVKRLTKESADGILFSATISQLFLDERAVNTIDSARIDVSCSP